jgi:hypothetical protein
MLAQLSRPIADSYWVQPGVLLAGEYPRNIDMASSKMKLHSLLQSGVTFFIDLTESWERGLRSYMPFLKREAAELGLVVGHKRMAISDFGTPNVEQMVDILNTIDAAVSGYHVVYVHCFGGVGRTGTVIGCHLVRHGMTGEEAISAIAQWRQDTPDGWRPSPENDAQRQVILNWQKGQ